MDTLTRNAVKAYHLGAPELEALDLWLNIYLDFRNIFLQNNSRLFMKKSMQGFQNKVNHYNLRIGEQLTPLPAYTDWDRLCSSVAGIPDIPQEFLLAPVNPLPVNYWAQYSALVWHIVNIIDTDSKKLDNRSVFECFPAPSDFMRHLIDQLDPDNPNRNDSTRLRILKHFLTAEHSMPTMVKQAAVSQGWVSEKAKRDETAAALKDEIFDIIINDKKHETPDIIRDALAASGEVYLPQGAAKEALYRFAIDYDMRWYPNEEEAGYDPNRDVEHRLFEDFYMNCLLQSLNSIGNKTGIKRVPLSGGICYSNAREAIYLYVLNQENITAKEKLRKVARISELVLEKKKNADQKNQEDTRKTIREINLKSTMNISIQRKELLSYHMQDSEEIFVSFAARSYEIPGNQISFYQNSFRNRAFSVYRHIRDMNPVEGMNPYELYSGFTIFESFFTKVDDSLKAAGKSDFRAQYIHFIKEHKDFYQYIRQLHRLIECPDSDHLPPVFADIDAFEEDVLLLARLIEYEAGGQNERVWAAIGEVVYNRLHSPAFPDSVNSVICGNGDSTPRPLIDEKMKLASITPREKVIRTARSCLDGQLSAFGNMDVVYFSKKDASDAYTKDGLCKLYAEEGDFAFYLYNGPVIKREIHARLSVPVVTRTVLLSAVYYLFRRRMELDHKLYSNLSLNEFRDYFFFGSMESEYTADYSENLSDWKGADYYLVQAGFAGISDSNILENTFFISLYLENQEAMRDLY